MTVWHNGQHFTSTRWGKGLNHVCVSLNWPFYMPYGELASYIKWINVLQYWIRTDLLFMPIQHIFCGNNIIKEILIPPCPRVEWRQHGLDVKPEGGQRGFSALHWELLKQRGEFNTPRQNRPHRILEVPLCSFSEHCTCRNICDKMQAEDLQLFQTIIRHN